MDYLKTNEFLQRSSKPLNEKFIAEQLNTQQRERNNKCLVIIKSCE